MDGMSYVSGALPAALLASIFEIDFMPDGNCIVVDGIL
ncbi:hypothetical protein KNP414_01102 [Paenibacillus mucilaginosus KNP414]|uniref:Uncharacterized protein n=1 Tax=Paenibacillus mucilaginosus (strain KNP414) TaxID=1036673 RepID=F8FCU8_PAEMK|nr:hypothetical protein KNP414_01102 [Paenibacillus mucilaginosus KNP414]